jgi:hypothetical protein
MVFAPHLFSISLPTFFVCIVFLTPILQYAHCRHLVCAKTVRYEHVLRRRGICPLAAAITKRRRRPLLTISWDLLRSSDMMGDGDR